MYDEFKAEIADLINWMKTEGVSETSSAVWCMNLLPKAYREFDRTYESRFAVDIATYQQGALVRFAEELGKNGKSAVSQLRDRFDKLNERFRLPVLEVPKRPPVPKPPARKKKRPAA